MKRLSVISLSVAAILWTMAIADFASAGKYSSSNTQVSCATTSTSVAAENASRMQIIAMNQSAIDVYLCYAGTCTTAIGTRLTENMGLVEDNYLGAVTCITSAGTATLSVKEQ